MQDVLSRLKVKKPAISEEKVFVRPKGVLKDAGITDTKTEVKVSEKTESKKGESKKGEVSRGIKPKIVNLSDVKDIIDRKAFLEKLKLDKRSPISEHLSAHSFASSLPSLEEGSPQDKSKLEAAVVVSKEEIPVESLVSPEEITLKRPKVKSHKKKLVGDKEKTQKKESSPKKGETKISLLTIKEIAERLPKKEKKVLIRTSQYYLNNREVFIKFIDRLFEPYKKELVTAEASYNCSEAGLREFNLLVHQKVVRDYINVFTPYRGLLLYHGLGSGKTCSSIAIAEGLKSKKQIIVMTPASLRRNYLEELKKCGDKLYKKNQWWDEIDIEKYPQLIKPLSEALSLSREFIKKNRRVWFVNSKKKDANYDTLSSDQQKSLDNQLTEMIYNKYKFINYNGLRRDAFLELTKKFATEGDNNLFSNKVVIIDEAHNFVSRIVNKLSDPNALSILLYRLLLEAQNTRIIFLTGTPIINYPNEIGIMLNMLRGYIKTWTFILSVNTVKKVSQESLINLFKEKAISGQILDYLQYSSGKLTITRNPFWFFHIFESCSGWHQYI